MTVIVVMLLLQNVENSTKKKNPGDFRGEKCQRCAILEGFVQEDFICKMKQMKGMQIWLSETILSKVWPHNVILLLVLLLTQIILLKHISIQLLQ